MMRIGIGYRLFLALLAATTAVVLCLVLIAQWSISRGFLQYVNTLEQERLATLAEQLAGAYGRSGDWRFLGERPAAWLRAAARGLPAEPPESAAARRPPRRDELRPDLPPARRPPGPPHRFENRILLLDARHRPLAGAHLPRERVKLQPLEEAGETIGYLGLLPRRELSDLHQLRFVRQQTLALALIAAVALAVSALIALPLARRLVRPIRALAAATNRLAAGEYQVRVPQERRDELGRLARDFNRLAATLERNEQHRRQWVADISHELRTPLAVLRGEVEALQDGVRPLTPDAVGSLHGEILRLGRLVDDLYQLALSDLGALSYHKQPLDLAAALREAVAAHRPAFERQRLVLAVAIPAEPVPVFGDPERLRQLFANLLDNARRYTDPGGRVEIALAREKGRALLDLRDSAPGVPAADLERLFERLYRAESSRSRASGGAGLGLAICRNIVAAHDGTVTARPSPLGGVWVRVELPTEEDA